MQTGIDTGEAFDDVQTRLLGFSYLQQETVFPRGGHNVHPIPTCICKYAYGQCLADG